MILHICSSTLWGESSAAGIYRGDTLLSEGFIHCSTRDQVVEVADYVFAGIEGLVLLVIDETKITETIKYEDAGNGKLYPHIYGPLDPLAVIRVVPFPPRQDGTFVIPASL